MGREQVWRQIGAVIAVAMLAACGGGSGGGSGDPDAGEDAGSGDTAVDVSEDTDASEDPGEDVEPDTPEDTTDSGDASDAADATDANVDADAADVDATDVDSGDTADADAGGPVCGDGIVEGDEACDLGDLAGATCETLGYTPGVLTCGADCRFRAGQCSACGDGICEGSETWSSCAADCAVVDVAAGATHSCAALVDGSVRCWGAREGHRAGGLPDVSVPTPIPGLVDIVEVAAGPAHTCAVDSAGQVWCWGRNGFQEAGPQSEAVVVWPPEIVEDLPAVDMIALGEHHGCAISNDSDVWCWGRGVFGQLGQGTIDGRSAGPEAIVVEGMSPPFAGLGIGDHHGCAMVDRGAAVCWGRNDQHQAGANNSLWRFEAEVATRQTWLVGAGRTAQLRHRHQSGGTRQPERALLLGKQRIRPARPASDRRLHWSAGVFRLCVRLSSTEESASTAPSTE